jgi:hypothetical protein
MYVVITVSEKTRLVSVTKHGINSVFIFNFYLLLLLYIIINIINSVYRALGSVVVKALCYKPEGRGFDAR